MRAGDLVRQKETGLVAIVLGEKYDHWLEGCDAGAPGWIWVRWSDGFVSQTTEKNLEIISEGR